MPFVFFEFATLCRAIVGGVGWTIPTSPLYFGVQLEACLPTIVILEGYFWPNHSLPEGAEVFLPSLLRVSTL